MQTLEFRNTDDQILVMRTNDILETMTSLVKIPTFCQTLDLPDKIINELKLHLEEGLSEVLQSFPWSRYLVESIEAPRLQEEDRETLAKLGYTLDPASQRWTRPQFRPSPQPVLSPLELSRLLPSLRQQWLPGTYQQPLEVKRATTVCLFAEFFLVTDPQRQAELDFVLQHHATCEALDHVIIFVCGNTEKKYVRDLVGDKVQVVRLFEERPTFGAMFMTMNHYLEDDNHVGIFLNSDVCVENDDVEKIRHLGRHDALALTRYEAAALKHPLVGEQKQGCGSQDTWIFRGPVNPALYTLANFSPGRLGCDNALAWYLCLVGYTLANPALTLRTYHCHFQSLTPEQEQLRRVNALWWYNYVYITPGCWETKEKKESVQQNS
jgi:hypothetical protein